MRTTRYTGAEFVILTMGVGIVVAFSAAIVNWVLGRFTGFRFLSQMAQQVTFVMVPPLFLIFLVLGTIFIGVATPTEGGAMGAIGSILLAMFKRWIDNDPRPLQHRAAALGGRGDRQAVRVRGVHPGRRAHLLADVLRRERPHLGRASVDVAAGRPESAS